MKTDTRMMLAPITALAVAFGAYAFSPQTEDFESYAEGTAATNVTKFCSIGGDESDVAAADGNKYLNVSTDEGTLFRSVNELDNGNIGAAAQVGPAGIDIDMAMKFTITAAGDEPEFSADDKLALWLQDEGTSTNLLARGGLYTGSEGTFVQTADTGTVYRLSGVTVNPGERTNVKIKALANINSGSTVVPGFEVWIGNAQATVAVADGLSALVSGTAIPSLSSSATLAAVGFSGNGAVDDISIVDNATAGTVIELVSGVTSTYNESTGEYTFTVPAGSVIGSLLVNGELVSAAAGQSTYTWTSVSGASVVVAAKKNRAAPAHKWFESPYVIATNRLHAAQTTTASGFKGGRDDNFYTFTYLTASGGYKMYDYDSLLSNDVATISALTATDAKANIDGYTAANATRGAAVSKVLNVNFVMSYSPGDKMLSIPLTSTDPAADASVIENDRGYAFDSGEFSPDGKYLFTNVLPDKDSGVTNTMVVKWQVLNGLKGNGTNLLYKSQLNVGDNAGSRIRHAEYARIDGKDLVYCLVDDIDDGSSALNAGIKIANMTDGTVTTLCSLTGKASYGMFSISGVASGTPHLTFGPSQNSTYNASTNPWAQQGQKLLVYTLAANGLSTVGDPLVYEFPAMGIPAQTSYGNSLMVSDDEETLFFAPADGIIYSVQYSAAAVNGFGYATFDAARAAIVNADDYVTLFADASATLAAGDTLKVKTNGHTFTANHATGVLVADSTDANGVTTFTTYVATVTKDGSTSYYGTLQAAIAYAADNGVGAVDLVGAATGAVNIPEGITVQLVSGCAIAGVTALSGAGVLFAPSGTVVPLVQTDHAATLLQDAEKWAGTLFIKNATMTGPDGLAYYGNTNSTVRFDNVWVGKFTSSHAIGTLEVVGSGFYIQSPLTANMTLPCALVGDGPISLRDASDTQRTVLFSGDVSAFTGNVTVATDTKSRIVFGTNAATAGNDNCIVVDSGVSVTVAEGKTWTAPNGYVIKGTVTVSGTLAAGSEKVYGTGCVIYTSATAAAASAPIAGSWTGTCVVGWAPTGAFNPNTYGNSSSTVVLSNDLAASAYFGPGSATTLTINPTVQIAADVEIKNGYSKADDSCLVTFTKLTGDHKFSTSPGTGGTDANPTTRRYAITTLDNFTGSLKVKAGSELRIATVNVADGTNLSGLIIPAECDAKSTVEGAHTDGVITGALALTVAGVDSGKTLEYKADGANGAGLYVVVPAVTYPTYVGSDTTLQSQYDVWKAAYRADIASAYETAFLLNVDPDTGDTTLDATAVTISGTTVTITIDHNSVNGYPYVKIAATLDGLSSATPVAATVVNGVITLPSQTGAAAFYKVGVSSTPIVAE